MNGRTPLVAGNWKMHHGVKATSAFCEEIINTDLGSGVDVVICPPFTSLPMAAMVLTESGIGLGAQNTHWEDTGAFTGEVAPLMLAELGVAWVIVGHSERRAIFGDTDETVVRRARNAQNNGLIAIVCVGETLEQREAEQTNQVLDRQAAPLSELDSDRLVVAYEPIWAIGTGRTATPQQAQAAHSHLRGRLTESFGADAAQKIRILYGGSVKPGNAAELFGQPDVDGGLVGGASLDVASFSGIIRAAAKLAAGESS